MDTDELVRVLARNAPAVRRISGPVVRSLLWLSVAAAVVVLLVLGHGVRPQLAERMRDLSFAVGMGASMLTAVLATFATFLASLPDRSRHWLWLPVPSLVLWLANIGYQCFGAWVNVPPGAVTVEAATDCMTTLVLTSLPLALLMVLMLRRVAAFASTPVVLVASLAVSAITSVALSMFHPLDATAMVLGWNLGTAVLFAVGAFAWRRLSASRPGRDFAAAGN